MEQLSEGQAVVVGGTGGTVQVVQMGQGGQAMMLPQAIQVAAPNGQIQVVPVSSLTNTGQQIVIQQPQTPQIIQTPDGQTYIYQPVQLEGQVQQAQPTGLFITNRITFPDLLLVKLCLRIHLWDLLHSDKYQRQSHANCRNNNTGHYQCGYYIPGTAIGQSYSYSISGRKCCYGN